LNIAKTKGVKKMNKISIDDVKKATSAYLKNQEAEQISIKIQEEEALARSAEILKFFEEIETMEGIEEVKKLLAVLASTPNRSISLYSADGQYDSTGSSFNKDGFSHSVNDRSRECGRSRPATNDEAARELGRRGVTAEQLEKTFFEQLSIMTSKALS